MRVRSLRILMCLLVTTTAGSAFAQAVSTRNQGADTETDDAFPVSFSASLSHYVGSGTFVIGPSSNPYVLSDLTLSLSYTIGRLTLTATEEAFVEWTDGDGSTFRQQPDMFDLGVRATFSMLDHEPSGFHFDVRAIGAVPFSLSSRAAGIVGSGGVGSMMGVNIPFVDIGVYGQAQLVGNLIVPALSNRLVSQPSRPYNDRKNGPTSTRTCLSRSAVELQSYACGTVPSLATAVGTLGAGRTFFVGVLSLDASTTVFSFVSSYFGPDDEFTSEHATPGPGFDIYTSGYAAVTVSPLPWFSVSLGTFSFQSLTTMNGRMLRFMFWDFLTPNDNNSTLFVSTTVSF